jgi:uncharacterized protein YdhG (YjbR/CyaY superfamily)
MKPETIDAYNRGQAADDKITCDTLRDAINAGLPQAESKIWHAHPVWFLSGNPIVGYSKLKAGIRLMFWSGADFGEAELKPGTGKFRDASIVFSSPDQIDVDDLRRWLDKAERIQWDYKNLMRKRRLDRLR